MRMLIRLLFVSMFLLVALSVDPFAPAEAGGARCPKGQKTCGKTCYDPATQCCCLDTNCCGDKIAARQKGVPCASTCRGFAKKPAKRK